MSQKKSPSLWIFLLLLLAGAWVFWKTSAFRGHTKTQQVTKESAPRPPVVEEPVSVPPQVAIVIDDVAYNTQAMDGFASLGIPLTFAILPRHKLAAPLALKAKELQFDVMLHLPMEPLDMVNFHPGPSGLLLAMSEKELKAQFDKAVQSVPGLVGINNHMGSAFTESEPKMTLVLGWAKERNLFFLDSYTTKKSVVLRAAKKVGIPCLQNEVFLDNADTLEGIEAQLNGTMRLALKNKRVIAIGHYRRKYLVEALSRKLPEFKAKGIHFVTLSTFYPT